MEKAIKILGNYSVEFLKYLQTGNHKIINYIKSEIDDLSPIDPYLRFVSSSW